MSITKEEYTREEREAYYASVKDDELDVDEISFQDQGDITIDDLKTSPALKCYFGRFISASNWLRWIL